MREDCNGNVVIKYIVYENSCKEGGVTPPPFYSRLMVIYSMTT